MSGTRLDYDLMPGLSNLYTDSAFSYIWEDEHNKLERKLENKMNKAFGLKDEWLDNAHPTLYRKPFLNDDNELHTMSISSCTQEICDFFKAFWDKIILKKPNVPPVKQPSILCWAGFVYTATLVIGVVGLISLFATGLFEGFGVVASFFESIFSNITSFFSTIVEYITFGFQYVIDGWKLMWDGIAVIRDFVVDLTGANGYLVSANLLTILAWCISQLVLEFFEVELEWEQTDFYNIFEFLDTPIHWGLDFIEEVTGGKDIIYYLCKIFLIPFEVGILIISLVIGLIWFLIKELIDVIRNS